MRISRLTMLLVAAALSAGPVALWATTSGSSPLAPRVAASVPSCAVSGLDVWFNTAGNGAAGTSYYEIELTNMTGHTCTVSGFPGVSAISLGGKQIGAAASRNSVAAHTVTLANENTATARLGVVNTGNFPASACKPVQAAGLRVYPPGSTSSREDWFPFSVCSKSSKVSLTINPLVS